MDGQSWQGQVSLQEVLEAHLVGSMYNRLGGVSVAQIAYTMFFAE